MGNHQNALLNKQPERLLNSTTTVAMTEGSNMQNQAAFRPKQSANYLAISIATFWRLVKAGELKTIKLSARCTGVLKSDLDDVATLNRTHNLKYCKRSVIPNERRKTQNLYSRIQSLSG